MSERTVLAETGKADQADIAGSVTAGALLKKSREAAGLHIGALAVALKVPVSKLEALESGNLAQLSGPVFVRALASSVCRTLKIDPAPILEHLPVPETAQLHQKGDLNEPFRGEGRGVHFSGSERLLKPSVLVVIALLVGSAVLMFLPNLRSVSSSGTSPGPAVPGAQAPVEEPASPAVPPAQTPAATVTAPSLPTVSPSPSAPPSSQATSTPQMANAGTGEPVQPAGRVDVVSAGASDALVFKASGSSWVEVTDAKGVVVFRKTLAAGESAQVGGLPPLKVVVGRADLTEVMARGTRLELQSLAKDNVARFEVK